MTLWTLFGLAKGRATTDWPGAAGSGQDGLFGMPRYDPAACEPDCAAACPTGAITLRPGAPGNVDVDYGRCVVCQLCVEGCPSGAMAIRAVRGAAYALQFLQSGHLNSYLGVIGLLLVIILGLSLL